MAFLDDLLDTLGALSRRAHLFTFRKVSAPGVSVAFTRDLRPIPDGGLTGGHLVELWAVLDDSDPRYQLTRDSRIRFDILEEDWLLSGGLDDQVLSILGTNAVPPDSGFTTEQRSTTFQELPEGMDVPAYIELYRRVWSSGTIAPFDRTILILSEKAAVGRQPGSGRTHVFTWWRTEHVADIGGHSELYAVLNVDGVIEAASPVLELMEAPPGVAVRVNGSIVDRQPLVATLAEPLPDVLVFLGGRQAITGDGGDFVIDAWLPVGDHRLQFLRPGIETRELTVRISVDAAGIATAAVLDGETELVTKSTTGVATQASRLDLTLPAANPITVLVGKVRGTVLWPDSRPGSENPAPYLPMPAAYHGTPLAERRIYVLPLPATGTLASHRPATTRAWEAMKQRAEVLRSARPGRPIQRERTDASGAFEVKYLDFSAGNRFLLWAERFDPQTAADTATETPDHVVRTLQRELIELHESSLLTPGVAGNTVGANGQVVEHIRARTRNLVDHEYNLTRDAVAWGVEALRVVDVATTRTLVRADRVGRERFEEGALANGIGERYAVPASQIIASFELQVLPLVLLHEPADVQSTSARRAREALDAAAAAAFPGGFDAGQVAIVLDAGRLSSSVELTSTAAAPWDSVADNAKIVELLERTFIVRPQLGAGRRLAVANARWHIDAVSLADGAFVSLPATAGDDEVANRRLDATTVPVLSAVSPVLPGLAPRHAYLAPGHGLYPAPGALTSNAPANWTTSRGGYLNNAGEDEVVALMASEVRRIGLLNGLAVTTSRELEDFTIPGVSNPAAGVFSQVVASDFPRLWQQNPVYFLGVHGDGAVIGTARDAPAGAKGKQGIGARVAHITAAAKGVGGRDPIDIVLAPHTNAGGSRGRLVEYLNVQPTEALAGESNPLGRSFATKLLDRMARTRLRLKGSSIINQDNADQAKPPFVRPAVPTYPVPAAYRHGLFTMNNINELSVADLVHTTDHFVRNTVGVVDDITKLRVATSSGVSVPALWAHQPFPVAIPVALAETGFHDSAEDSALLSRAWFRRLAAEGMAEAIDDQLRDDPSAITGNDVIAVLRQMFNDTPAVQAVVGGTVALGAAAVQAAVRTVADATSIVTAPTLGALATAALAAAAAQTRRRLVELLRDELQHIAGYDVTDAGPGGAIDTFIVGPMVGSSGLAALARPDAPVTRAEAGVFACRGVGLPRAGLRSAETQPRRTGHPVLIRPAPGRATAYFPPVEAALLVEQIRALEPQSIYSLADAFFADAGWNRLDVPRGSGTYLFDPATPVLIVAETAGSAWNAAVTEIEFGIVAGTESRTLGCSRRDPGRLISRTWSLNLPPTQRPLDVTVTVRVKHPTSGWLSVGVQAMQLQVVQVVTT